MDGLGYTNTETTGLRVKTVRAGTFAGCLYPPMILRRITCSSDPISKSREMAFLSQQHREEVQEI